jgi:quercetin dioxygenase-like cupin family protein
MSRSPRRPAARSHVFSIDSVPFHDVPWGRTKILLGRDVHDPERASEHVQVALTENSAGSGGSHRLHVHPDQDEVLIVLEGRGENISGDGTVRQLRPGDVVFIQAGTPHEDRSVDGPVRFLVVKTPPD